MENRILVVDDDALFREAAALVLRGHGHAVEVAASVEEADRLLAQNTFALVLLDIHIPGNTRLEWLRARAGDAKPPAVILCTGYPTLDTAIDAVGLPASGYLVKPVSDDRLLAEVDRVLDEVRASVTAAGATTPLSSKLDAARERFELTRRQAEVLALLAGGRANREVAEELGCALRTVELHVTEILRKTGARSRTALIALVLGGLDDDR